MSEKKAIQLTKRTVRLSVGISKKMLSDDLFFFVNEEKITFLCQLWFVSLSPLL